MEEKVSNWNIGSYPKPERMPDELQNQVLRDPDTPTLENLKFKDVWTNSKELVIIQFLRRFG